MSLRLPDLVFTASPNFSSRGGERVRLIVAHDCEGSYAGSVAWFAQARSQVSAHVVLGDDGEEATLMVAWANKAWHACAFNAFSEGIEAAGFAGKGFAAPEWDALAAIVAYRLRVNGIPCQPATDANGWTGYCQHADLGAMGGGHHDLTSDAATWRAFETRVAAAYAKDMPDHWRAGQACGVPAAPKDYRPSGTLRAGLPYGSLEWAQAGLNALGAPRIPLIVDGIEGARTRQAIADFQRGGHLYVDGELGPKTIAAIAAALNGAKP